MCIAQAIVQYMLQFLFPNLYRIELYDRMQAHLCQQIATDAFYLVLGATMECRKRCCPDKIGTKWIVTILGIFIRYLRTQLIDKMTGMLHLLHKLRHRFALDPLE